MAFLVQIFTVKERALPWTFKRLAVLARKRKVDVFCLFLTEDVGSNNDQRGKGTPSSLIFSFEHFPA